MKVNSTLTSINLFNNYIGNEGAVAIAEALKVNSTLTSINLCASDIGNDGAVAIAEALKVNSTLTSIALSENDIGMEGAVAIAKALRFNPTLSYLNLGTEFASLCTEALIFAVDTQHHLIGLLENLMDADGALFLASKFRMKVRKNVFDNETKVKQIGMKRHLDEVYVEESLTEPEP